MSCLKKNVSKAPVKAPKELPEDGNYYGISPEEVKVGIDYAITINPSDDYQYFKSEDRLKEFTEFWQIYIQTLQCQIKLNLEVSKLGRLHWHGHIKFHTQKNINMFYINNVHALSLRSMHLIKPITEPEEWNTYISKSKHMFDVKIETTDANIKRLSMAEVSASKHKIPNIVKHKDFF